MSYISADQLKTYIGLSSSITDDDTVLQMFCDSATQLIEAEVGFSFKVSADTTRYFTYGIDVAVNGAHWRDRQTLIFDTWLASAPTTVTNGDATTISSSDYILKDANRAPYYSLQLKENTTADWTYSDSPENAISVTGKWGWSTKPPSDILQLTYRLSAYFYRQKDSQIFDSTAFSELGPIQLKAQLPSDAMSMLSKYIWRTS